MYEALSCLAFSVFKKNLTKSPNLEFQLAIMYMTNSSRKKCLWQKLYPPLSMLSNSAVVYKDEFAKGPENMELCGTDLV